MPYATLVMEDGAEVLIEVEDNKRYRGQLSEKGVFVDLKERFSDIMKLVEEMARSVHAGYESLPKEVRPKELEMTFGITISAEAGVIFSKVGSGGSFEVTLRWASG
jgi:hypothetical protein